MRRTAWSVGLAALWLTAGCASRPTSPPVTTEPVVEEEPVAPPVEEVKVDLPVEARSTLILAIETDLEAARKLLESARQRTLTEAQTGKLRSVEGLIQAALVAREEADLHGAAALAKKARLLANELGPG